MENSNENQYSKIRAICLAKRKIFARALCTQHCVLCGNILKSIFINIYSFSLEIDLHRKRKWINIYLSHSVFWKMKKKNAWVSYTTARKLVTLPNECGTLHNFFWLHQAMYTRVCIPIFSSCCSFILNFIFRQLNFFKWQRATLNFHAHTLEKCMCKLAVRSIE